MRCYDPATKRQLWFSVLENEIDSFSVASTKDRLYVLDNTNAIHVFRLSDGKKTSVVTWDQLRQNAGRLLAAPCRLAWIPDADQLLVTTHSQMYGENGILFDAATFKKAATMKCDGLVTEITTTADGRFIVTVSHSNNVRIWDTNTGKEVFKVGENERPATDAPFISNAMFDGDRTLVYTVDDSWLTGKVFVHDILANKELASFDSRNGHVVMDVDFAHSRIALTGTERGLTVCDLTGKVIADKAEVTWQRNVAIAFSATGKRLAVGSLDHTVRVFDLREGGGD